MHELSKALPEDQRPLPLDKVQVNDNASFWLPNSGGTAGSTAAEGSCEAVRMACEQLVRQALIPHLHHSCLRQCSAGCLSLATCMVIV